MSELDWAEVKLWYGRALDTPVADRDGLLSDAGLSAACRSSVIRLLAAHQDAPVLVAAGPPFQGVSSAARGDLPADPPGSRPADAPLDPGDIGPFRVVRPLGSGGFGTVYLAEERAPACRTVALKVLSGLAAVGKAAARFALEQRALAGLDHPGIARFYQSGQLSDGRPWFAMEYVDGLPLRTWAQQEKPEPAALALLFAELADAVLHAHERGVIHRDLKPANVLVARRAGAGSASLAASAVVPPTAHSTGVASPWQAKIIDFGIAKIIDPDHPAEAAVIAAGDDMTVSRVLIGTPRYMSPEQLAGQHPDIRSDIFAIGIMLNEAMQAADIAPQPSGGSLRRLVLQLRLIAERAAAPGREDRYPDSGALALDLRNALAGLPTRAGRPTVAERLRVLWRDHRVAGVAAAGAAGVLTTFAGGALVAQRASEAGRREAVRQLERTRKVQRFVLSDVMQSPGMWTPTMQANRWAALIDLGMAAAASAERQFVDDPAALATVALNAAEIQQRMSAASRDDLAPERLRSLIDGIVASPLQENRRGAASASGSTAVLDDRRRREDAVSLRILRVALERLSADALERADGVGGGSDRSMRLQAALVAAGLSGSDQAWQRLADVGGEFEAAADLPLWERARPARDLLRLAVTAEDVRRSALAADRLIALASPVLRQHARTPPTHPRSAEDLADAASLLIEAARGLFGVGCDDRWPAVAARLLDIPDGTLARYPDREAWRLSLIALLALHSPEHVPGKAADWFLRAAAAVPAPEDPTTDMRWTLGRLSGFAALLDGQYGPAADAMLVSERAFVPSAQGLPERETLIRADALVARAGQRINPADAVDRLRAMVAAATRRGEAAELAIRLAWAIALHAGRGSQFDSAWTQALELVTDLPLELKQRHHLTLSLLLRRAVASSTADGNALPDDLARIGRALAAPGRFDPPPPQRRTNSASPSAVPARSSAEPAFAAPPRAPQSAP